jgi:hypothetical protein
MEGSPDRGRVTAQHALPAAALAVGVCGHRPGGLAGADYALLQERAKEALAAVQRACPGAPIVVLSPIAEGADRIVARAGLQAGHALRCVLPFVRAEYARDFATDASRAEFVALLGSAAEVVELDGHRATPEHADTAYAAAGAWVVERADVLIAIWNGLRARNRGGTGDVVQQALAAGLPVIWIAAQAPHATRLLVNQNGAGQVELPFDRLATLLPPSRC